MNKVKDIAKKTPFSPFLPILPFKDMAEREGYKLTYIILIYKYIYIYLYISIYY